MTSTVLVQEWIHMDDTELAIKPFQVSLTTIGSAVSGEAMFSHRPSFKPRVHAGILAGSCTALCPDLSHEIKRLAHKSY